MSFLLRTVLANSGRVSNSRETSVITVVQSQPNIRKYQKKKTGIQAQINTPPKDILKKSPNLSFINIPATPPSILIPTPIITETASDSKHRDHLEVKLGDQQPQLDNLIKRVNQIEREVLILGSQLIISENVSNLLKKKADGIEAYSQRPCVLIII